LRVRALTCFAREPRAWGRSGVAEVIRECVEILDRASSTLSEHGYVAWTLRISLPLPPRGRLSTVVDAAGDALPKGVMLSAGGALLKGVGAGAVAEAASAGIYVPLLGLDEGVPTLAGVAAKAIHRAAEESPVNAARVAVLAGREPLETPYYPLSTSSGVPGLGLSYLYVDLMQELLSGGLSPAGLAGMLSAPASLLAKAGFRVTADYSLSPWMEDSVAALIKKFFGTLPPALGVNYAVAELNRAIQAVMRQANTPPSGFNEVMLPYAEDSTLKELGRLGRLSVKDLLTYSASCVAGPDMAVVPWDVESLTALIKDAYAIHVAKRKALGVRVVPVTEDAGATVDLGMFGEVPVIRYM